jgi:hypothetical protein
MSRPHNHPKTGVYYFRRAVPADLRLILGKREELRSPETKDSTRAREFHAAISGEVDRHWKALGQPTQPLRHQQVLALSGLVYKMMTEGHVDDPGSSSLWQGLMLLQNNAINPDRLAQWLGPTVDAILVREGVRTDEASRSRLIEEVRKGTNQAAAQLARMPMAIFSLILTPLGFLNGHVQSPLKGSRRSL